MKNLTRENYVKTLENLKDSLIKMCSAVENALIDAFMALWENDKEVANKVYDGDDLIDEMYDNIMNKCIHIIATQSPIAGDLRLVTGALNMLTDLERIADQAADIAEIVKENHLNSSEYNTLKKMSDVSILMVKNSINSLISGDIKLALEVTKKDDEVDALFAKLIIEFETIMMNNPNKVDEITKLLFVAKYIERIADHATNVAENVIYTITGKRKNTN